LPNSVGVGIDISAPALEIAEKNARKNGISTERTLFLVCPFAKISSIWSGSGKKKSVSF
jgi:methylase of polypeptide subunit release factors